MSFLLFSVIEANPEAKRLYEELIKVRAYNKLIRPVKNNSEKLTVYLGLRLTQLLDVVCSSLSSLKIKIFHAQWSLIFQGWKESNHDIECLVETGNQMKRFRNELRKWNWICFRFRFRNGTMINFDGIQVDTVVSMFSTFPVNRSGCLILFCTISKNECDTR